jgi:hypothetical protein
LHAIWHKKCSELDVVLYRAIQCHASRQHPDCISILVPGHERFTVWLIAQRLAGTRLEPEQQQDSDHHIALVGRLPEYQGTRRTAPDDDIDRCAANIVHTRLDLDHLWALKQQKIKQ